MLALLVFILVLLMFPEPEELLALLVFILVLVLFTEPEDMLALLLFILVPVLFTEPEEILPSPGLLDPDLCKAPMTRARASAMGIVGTLVAEVLDGCWVLAIDVLDDG